MRTSLACARADPAGCDQSRRVAHCSIALELVTKWEFPCRPVVGESQCWRLSPQLFSINFGSINLGRRLAYARALSGAPGTRERGGEWLRDAAMPRLKCANRYWAVASDDFVAPVMCDVVVRVIMSVDVAQPAPHIEHATARSRPSPRHSSHGRLLTSLHCGRRV